MPLAQRCVLSGIGGKMCTTSSNGVVVTAGPLSYIHGMNLREQVEDLLPNWERWYPSLFDAASDLGIIRARVCDLNSLLLSNRHARLRQRAEDAHREQWGGRAHD